MFWQFGGVGGVRGGGGGWCQGLQLGTAHGGVFDTVSHGHHLMRLQKVDAPKALQLAKKIICHKIWANLLYTNFSLF